MSETETRPQGSGTYDLNDPSRSYLAPKFSGELTRLERIVREGALAADYRVFFSEGRLQRRRRSFGVNAASMRSHENALASLKSNMQRYSRS